jgi:hypothetical protein
MDPDAIVGVIFIAGIVVLVFLIRRVRTAKTVFITDYQRGVRFVNGVFRDVLGPGRYRSYTGHDLINIVDMRPNPFLAERISYQDALQSPSIMSIGAELLVSDPYVVSTKLKNPVDDSIPVAREIVKSFAAGNITDARPEARAKTAEEITKAVNRELSQFGMAVRNLEITEVWSRHLQQITGGAN